MTPIDQKHVECSKEPDREYIVSVFEGGSLLICCGGYCIRKPITDWHKDAKDSSSAEKRGFNEGIDCVIKRAEQMFSDGYGVSDVLHAIRAMRRE